MTLFVILFKLTCLAKSGSTQGTVPLPLWSALLLQYKSVNGGRWWERMEHCSNKNDNVAPSTVHQKYVLCSPGNYCTGTLIIYFTRGLL